MIDEGKVYADGRGNAVFLMVAGKANRPIGAELRGTGPRIWRGLAPGTRRDAGYFWVGAKGSQRVVLCESAIDAISLLPAAFNATPCRVHLHLDGGCSRRCALAIFTAGSRLPDPLWLRQRRSWRGGQLPDDRPPQVNQTPATTRPRLERRA